MVEPLALAAGISTLIATAYRLSKTIYETIDDAKNAPKHLRLLSKDLKAFYSILGSLYEYLREDDTATGVLHPTTSPDLEAVLSNCVSIFQDLQGVVGEFVKDEASGNVKRWHLVKLPWRENEIVRLKEHLAAYKITLNVAIATANFINTSASLAATRSIESELKELRLALTSLLIRMEKNENRDHERGVILDNYQASIQRFANSTDSILTSFTFERPSTPSGIVSTVSSGDKSSAYLTAKSTCGKAESYISGGVSQSFAILSTYETAPNRDSGTEGHADGIDALTNNGSLPNPSLSLRSTPCHQIFVKGLVHQTLVIDMTRINTFTDLQYHLHDRCHIPAERISLTYNGRVLRQMQEDEVRKMVPNNATLQANINAYAWELLDDDNVADNLNSLWSPIWRLFYSRVRSSWNDEQFSINSSSHASSHSTIRWYDNHEERTRNRYMRYLKNLPTRVTSRPG